MQAVENRNQYPCMTASHNEQLCWFEQGLMKKIGYRAARKRLARTAVKDAKRELRKDPNVSRKFRQKMLNDVRETTIKNKTGKIIARKYCIDAGGTVLVQSIFQPIKKVTDDNSGN